MGVVRFNDSSSAENPLPDHDDNGVDVRARRGLVISDSEGNHGKTRNRCEFHHEKGYETQESVKFKALVPGMMDDKEIKLCEEIKEEKNIHTMLGKGNHGKTRNRCEFHHEKGYETQESVKFKALVPGMMDDKEIKLCEEIKEEKNIHTMLGSVHINDIFEDTNKKGPC
ncbi:hypothetical protein GOBAR_DD19119 [Gossypium barbadense]|nr:hypothetical protein GOBAR_DD19119 [Gossypium barbadense]